MASDRRPIVAYSEGADMRSTESLVRHCEKCGKVLRSNNTKDTCSACRTGASTKSEPSVASASRDIIQRFRKATTLFGLNPDEMISDYCQRWLSRVSGAAKGEGNDESSAC